MAEISPLRRRMIEDMTVRSLSVVDCSKPVSRVPSASLPTITPQAIARSPLPTSPSVLIVVAPCGGSEFVPRSCNPQPFSCDTS